MPFFSVSSFPSITIQHGLCIPYLRGKGFGFFFFIFFLPSVLISLMFLWLWSSVQPEFGFFLPFLHVVLFTLWAWFWSGFSSGFWSYVVFFPCSPFFFFLCSCIFMIEYMPRRGTACSEFSFSFFFFFLPVFFIRHYVPSDRSSWPSWVC